jgi:hypothetical protein
MQTQKKNVKQVFGEYVPIRKFDRTVMKRVLDYVNRFVRGDESRILFLGGNLIGVHAFKYLDHDRVEWLEDILNIDDTEGLREEIRNNTGINKDFFVSSDVTNLSLVWAAHMALTSHDLGEGDRLRLATACIDMLQYKFLSSIHTRFFKYTANEGIAKATYEALDKKSGLKKYGTWKGLLDSRTEDILSRGGIHYRTLREFDNDEDIAKMLNDIQGRLKAVMIKLTDTFNRLREADTRIQSTTKFTTVDGEVILKESSNRYERIRDRLHTVIPSRNDFVKDDLVEAIVKIVSTVSRHQLEECLYYMSDNYNSKIGKELHDLVNDCIIYAFDVIRQERLQLDHIPSVMLKLRSMYRSSRAIDPLLVSVRERTGSVVSDALNTHSTGTIASTRIGVILYIVLRGLVEK